MHWRRSLHSVLNGKNGCHHASRETPDPESSPSGCIDEGRCTQDFTGKTAVTTLRERRLIPRVHLLDAVTKVVALWTEREKKGCIHASREKADPYSSPSGCSDEGRCTPDWTGKTAVTTIRERRLILRVHLLETPDPESSPSGCIDEGRCTPDWTGKTAVTSLRERRLIPRVHLLDALTKVVALRTEREKRLSPRFERDAWSREFTFWMQWRRSLHSVLNGNTAVTSLRERRLIPRVHLVDAVKIVVGLRTERENGFHHASRETPDLESSPSRDAWSWEFTFWMHWRRSLHSGLNGENGSHIASRETPDPESSPSGCSNEGHCIPDWTGKNWLLLRFKRDAWSREFTFWMQWRRSLHSGLNGKKWLLLHFERDAWSLKFTFWMQWRRSLPAGLNGENGCHHALKETTDFESSPSGCSDEGRCTPDLPGKTAVTSLRERRLIPRVHLLETPDPEGRWTPDWTENMAVITLRERRLIPRVHLLDVVTKVIALRTVREKKGCIHASREKADPYSSPSGCIDEGRCTPDWTGKTAVTTIRERRLILRVHLLETPDPKSSPSGCIDEGRCTPDWTGKTAVTSLRERRLIPRVHLLDAVT